MTEKQVRAQVLSLRRKVKNGAKFFALRAGGWTGPERLEIEGIEHLVTVCLSDLQMREAMLRAEEEEKPAILLCALRAEELGGDVVDRLARQRVALPQPDEMVAELFSAVNLDPRVRKSRPLMQALLDWAPPPGYPPVAGGVLDVQTAWLALLGVLVGERVEAPSLTRFLEWTLSPVKRERLASLPPDLRAALGDWFARAKGEAIRFMLAAMESGPETNLVALGAALGLIFDPAHQRNGEHQAARGRLERYLGHRAIDMASAQAWFRAAESILLSLKTSAAGGALRPVLNRMDELLDALGLADQCWGSPYSLLGLEQRYRKAGSALRQVLQARKAARPSAVAGALAEVRRHFLGAADPERLSRLEMAHRLVQWPEVQKTFAAILQRVEARAEATETLFARDLQEWTRSEALSPRFIPIENLLAEAVGPVAKQQPVLLLVLDGMSMAVFRQLMEDLLRHDWMEIGHEELRLPRPVLATLPSITGISRRALFLGRLDPARSGTEEGDLKRNDFLFQTMGGQVRPQLFKMGDLAGEENEGVPAVVRQAIAEKRCRLVAVVLNAIDDHLDSGRQVDFIWTRNTIRGFRDLLRQASETGRLVMLASDHGHVLDFGSRQLPAEKEGHGDRYRVAEGAVKPGELEFQGGRIARALGTDRVTLACAADLRYGPAKRGYHGGANPQEVVAPLAILADTRGGTPRGWRELPAEVPGWWRLDGEEKPAPAPVAKPRLAAAREPDLFELAQPQKPQVWIEALLRSPLYATQAKLAARGAPAEETVTRLLAGLEARGGTALRPALAQDLRIPSFRVDGLVLTVSRILNIDGYEILKFDRGSETVTLNLELLRTQFDLGTAP